MIYEVEYKGITIKIKRLENGKFLKPELSKFTKSGYGCTFLGNCRIPYNNETPNVGGRANHDRGEEGYGFKLRADVTANQEGRFPSHLLVEDNILDIGQNFKSKSFITKEDTKGGSGFSLTFKHKEGEIGGHDDEGDLSRYFSLDAWYTKNVEELPDYIQRIYPFLYVPKPSPNERNENLNIEEEQKWLNGGGETGITDRQNVKTKNVHPTVKPIKLMTYLVTLGSRSGDTVLDPFMGSGTTGVACKILHRNFIGFEINVKYFEIAKERIDNKITRAMNISDMEEEE